MIGPVVGALGVVYHATYFDALDDRHGFVTDGETGSETVDDAESWGTDVGSTA